jgi:hypothetical protein
MHKKASRARATGARRMRTPPRERRRRGRRGPRTKTAAYVDLFAAVGPAVSRRTQAKRVLDELFGRDLIVADFRRVSSATEAFADELLVDWPRSWGARVEAINLSANVERVVGRVLHLRDARHGQKHILWGKGYSWE